MKLIKIIEMALEKIGLTNEPQILYVVESSPADIS